jgi:hypothetical protein
MIYGKLKERIINSPKKYLILGGILFVIVELGVALALHHFYSGDTQITAEKITAEKPRDTYIAFVAEIYDKIKENYWEQTPDDQLSLLYKLAAEKITGKPQILDPKNKTGVSLMTEEIIKEMDAQKKKEFVVNLSDMVLANLKPFGRNHLLTTASQKELLNEVNNIDPNANLYAALGVPKDASQKEINSVYQKKTEELKKENTPSSQQQLAQIERAYQTLSDQKSRQIYDASGAETTVVWQVIKPNIFYIRITRISPATIDEFKRAADKASETKGLNALILDLRGNIGGAVDIMPYFLGPFIGYNQTAYEFFHQGQYLPFRTQTGWLDSLVRYKKVVVLIDGQTQSSAEVMAATLKKYNVGVLVGTPTKGWGTIEGIYNIENQIDINEKFSALLVNSLTLRDDNNPIEGKGVDPAIYITDPKWPDQLFEYFESKSLVQAVKEIVNSK